MSINRFFNKSVVVQRLREVANGRAYSTTATVDCALQEKVVESGIELDQVQSRLWQAYFDIDENIQEGDLIVDGYGVLYKVNEVTRKDYGINQHLDVVLVEYDDNNA